MEIQANARDVYPVWEPERYQKAGPTDLIELRPAPGGNVLLMEKSTVEALARAVIKHKPLHVSGPTGTAKSSLIKALCHVEENFRAVCEALGFPVKPVRIYEIEMVTFEAPGELHFRRALRDGTTFDEDSTLVQALLDADAATEACYPVIWLKEIGRVHSASVQGGLLNLMDPAEFVLWDGRRIDGRGIAWLADSNYQAEQDATHVLVTLDAALQRRFVNHLTLDYLAPEQEVQVLLRLAEEAAIEVDDDEVILRIVKLGHVIRRHREEGNLQSISPPTIPSFLEMLAMLRDLPHWSLQQVAQTTLFGNASRIDRQHVPSVFNEVFGLHGVEDDYEMGGNLF